MLVICPVAAGVEKVNALKSASPLRYGIYFGYVSVLQLHFVFT